MSSPIPFVFQIRLFIFLSLTFMAFAVIGTLSHEGGHWLADRYFGYRHASINYHSTPYGDVMSPSQTRLIDIWQRNKDAIQNNKPFPEQAEFTTLKNEASKQSFIIFLAGPLQTMLTGTIGLLLLLIYRKSYWQTDTLKAWQWLWIMLSLFWMRQLFNLLTGVLLLVIKGRIGQGDETNLSQDLGLPPSTIYIVTGGVAILILAIIFFRIIPTRQRLTFLLASLFGGIGGSILWLWVLGPVLMP